MKTIPLTPNMDFAQPELTRSAEAVLVGEICERFVEWSEDCGRRRVHSWLSRVATLACDPESTEAVWLFLRLSTGDLSELTASFSELGADHHRSKQAQQQETERAMRVILRHFPELAKQIDLLKRQ